jgi:UDP-N-acetyl-D-glucosamine dehydrogenase
MTPSIALQPELVTTPVALPQPAATVAILGLGYVGLPTALALSTAGCHVLGVDVSPARLEAIRGGDVDLTLRQCARLAPALERDDIELTADGARIAAADAVLICVPTPVDEDRRPDLRYVASACDTAVRHARPGQLLVLTSTTHVGTTREMLIEPLEARGLRVGEDVAVAFAPERINPGSASHDQEAVPRVVGGATPSCAERAAELLGTIAAGVHVVSSPEAAELTKLHENTYRAVNIALANEMADAAGAMGLDPAEIVAAAATKPYGFEAFHPGPGVGGHCIPCDPHYLLAPLHAQGRRSPLVEQAMAGIARRPARVAARVETVLEQLGVPVEGARVLVVGVAYKAGVRDVRESPAVEIITMLSRRGIAVAFHDRMVRRLEIDGLPIPRQTRPRPAEHDLALITSEPAARDREWLDDFAAVLDATYRTAAGRRRFRI